MSRAPQVVASDPHASVFVAANAGSGKTTTLVSRVARLLLAGAAPESILCVTYTKAGAAEMQRRLFQQLGDWAVMDDGPLSKALSAIDEADRFLPAARSLFARALETPGGLKIQTIHAFCEKLLRRFPLEAGVSPGFTVLEDAAAAEMSTKAREGVARFALANPDGPIAKAYAHASVELDWRRFNDMFVAFQDRRGSIAAYVSARGGGAGVERDVWARCGFDQPCAPEDIEAEAVGRTRWSQWRRVTEATSGEWAARMRAVNETSPLADFCTVFCTLAGEPRKLPAKVDGLTAEWLRAEQARIVAARDLVRAAVVARDTVHALTLATAYDEIYQGAKRLDGALDFTDLVARTHHLLTVRADAAWVLYKLDGGIEHLLLDEAQDTAPDQWDILRALTAEFFTGAGAAIRLRTVFAVGDEKQSIFSFQGAAPERFAAEGQALQHQVRDAGLKFEAVPLTESWRSAPEVLGFVDTVFEDPGALAGLRPGGGNIVSYPLHHTARRGPGGSVELWPVEAAEPWEEPDPWLPADTQAPENANRKLAVRLAKAIFAMIARGEGVYDRRTGKMRPCLASDFLILVRRRNALFHEIIRALKREGVPVGGADRLLLSEHGLFQDLMALGRFAGFPPDDLTLATLLRSPLCDLSDDSLFDLAWNREGSLWAALNARVDERPEWASARDLLGWARAEAGRRPPFDFYARFLSRLDGEGRSMRQRLLTRLGAEAEDALDAFLAEVLAAEARDVRDLEIFLAEMASTEIEVKREQDETDARSGGEVRVMTVHGAKGLEAPIVILPDTTSRVVPMGGPLLDAERGGFLWAPRKSDDCAASGAARAMREALTERESSRLLYVALTRARDRLIVCGVKSPRFERSWRDYIERAFAKVETHPFYLDDGVEAQRYGVDPAPAVEAQLELSIPDFLPRWLSRPAPAERPLARYASPSGLGETEADPAPSPLAAVNGLGRYRRGDIVHRLLQHLPDIAPADRAAAAARMLARERDLSPDQAQEMAAAALGVVADPRFAAVFGPGSRAEIALAGAARRLPSGFAISGRVDRLVVEPDRVLVVDYKTNRPSPDRIEDADNAYILQMAVYTAVLAEVFPGRRIEAALVWTDGPKLMPVPENLMAVALDALAAKG